jgi:hypothetical protein
MKRDIEIAIENYNYLIGEMNNAISHLENLADYYFPYSIKLEMLHSIDNWKAQINSLRREK